MVGTTQRQRRPASTLGLLVLLGLAATASAAKPQATTLGQTTVVAQDYLQIELTRRAGIIQLKRVSVGRLKKPQRFVRFRGRFVAKLYAQRRLLDAYPFSFALTLDAGEPTRQNIGLDNALAAGSNATTQVRVPLLARLTHVVVVDQRSGQLVHVPLPKATRSSDANTLPVPKRTDVFRSNDVVRRNDVVRKNKGGRGRKVVRSNKPVGATPR
ncbi:MAG: hypothetical protein H6707_08285 [Deltaproteobacteria bacterium]|nr:hypothetical protein [Deltaproteobacteria bacterium]